LISGGGYSLSLGSSIAMAGTAQCSGLNPACYPMGIDMTRVNGANTPVVLGNGVSAPNYIGMTLTAPGTLSPIFTNTPVCTSCALTFTESPEFGPEAWSTGGPGGSLYFGASGTPAAGHTGIAECSVSAYVITCPNPSWPPLQYACAACNAGNIALANTSPSPSAIWQTVFQAGTSYVDLPKSILGVLSAYRGRINPSVTVTPAYSIAAYPGRPLN
jgi:hypothetical protein